MSLIPAMQMSPMPSDPPNAVTQTEDEAVGGSEEPELTGLEEPEKTIIEKQQLYKIPVDFEWSDNEE